MARQNTTTATAARPEQYDPVAKTLHWLMALAILFLIAYGLYMVAQPPSMRLFRIYDFHKAVGMSLLVLALARLAWRFVRPAPPTLTEGVKPWELWLAHVVHILLYALMLIIPLVGWIGASASGLPMSFFGLFPIPGIAPGSEDIQNAALALHGWLNWLFIFVILLHIAGALKRHFILRDATLRRMLPFGLRNSKRNI